MAKKRLTMKELLGRYEKKHGAGSIGKASTAKGLSLFRIPTGIFGLDYVLGGGIPQGRFTLFFGKQSAGKTASALKTVVSAQHICREHLQYMHPTEKPLYRCPYCGFLAEENGVQCPDCAEAEREALTEDWGDFEYVCPTCGEYNPMITYFVDAEGTWDSIWATALGVNSHYVYLSQPVYGEQAVDMAADLLYTGEVDLIIVDTLAQLVPQKELEEEAGKALQAPQARLLNKMFRIFEAAINEPGIDSLRRPTILLLNQVRMKIGTFFGDPEIKPGGMGQNFYASTDIKFWGGKYLLDDDGNPLTATMKFKAIKNKTCAAMRTGSYRMHITDMQGKRAGYIEETEIILTCGFKAGFFGSSKEGWSVLGEEFKRKKDIVEYLTDPANEPKLLEVRKHLLQMPLGTVDADAVTMEVDDD